MPAPAAPHDPTTPRAVGRKPKPPSGNVPLILAFVAFGFLALGGGLFLLRSHTPFLRTLGGIGAPVGLITLGSMFFLSMWEDRTLRRRKRRRQCIECGYPRARLDDMAPCPECGARAWGT